MKIPKTIYIRGEYMAALFGVLLLIPMVIGVLHKIREGPEEINSLKVEQRLSTPSLDRAFVVKIGTTLEEAKSQLGEPKKLHYNIDNKKSRIICSWKHGGVLLVVEFINGKARSIYSETE